MTDSLHISVDARTDAAAKAIEECEPTDLEDAIYYLIESELGIEDPVRSVNVAVDLL